MPDKKISELDTLTAPAGGDYLPIVDVSDTTMGSSGTTKKVAVSVLTAGSGGGGALASVGLTMPADVFAVASSPLTADGVIAVAFASQTARTFLAAPTGSAGVPAFRAIDPGDVPSEGLTLAAWSSPIETVTDGATVSLDFATNARKEATIAGNRTIALANLVRGRKVELVVIQDGTGSRTLSWPAEVHWAGGTAPTLATAAGHRDTIVLDCRGPSLVIGYHAGASA